MSNTNTTKTNSLADDACFKAEINEMIASTDARRKAAAAETRARNKALKENPPPPAPRKHTYTVCPVTGLPIWDNPLDEEVTQ